MLRRILPKVRRLRRPSKLEEPIAAQLFDTDFYLAAYPDVAASGENPLGHYLNRGWREGRQPHALFDGAWYLERYPDVRASGINPLVHYLTTGHAEARSPHPLFDAQWYLAAYPDVAASGENPLRDYLDRGWREGRQPHALFDGAWYLERYPDVRASGINPLVHYLTTGHAEARSPHPLFDAQWYLAAYPDVAASGENPLRDYLDRGWREGRQPHALFDGAWYLERYPDVRASGINPLVHYLTTGHAEARSPHPLFDAQWYLDHNPDVRAAGVNPLVHYVMAGHREGRDPHPSFAGDWYVRTYMGGQRDAAPLIHYVVAGWKAGARPNPDFDLPGSGNGHLLTAADEAFRWFAAGKPAEGGPWFSVGPFLKSIFGPEVMVRIERYYRRYRLVPDGGRPPSPPQSEAEIAAWIAEMSDRLAGATVGADIVPDVSIIIPVFNNISQTMACLHSLADLKPRRSFEIIIADDASTDATPEVISRLPGVVLARSDVNGGFIANCNRAAVEARGRYLVFLNNDTIVLPGWLDELVDTLERDDSIGLVGSKLIFGNGRLQEAGGIVWRDGSAWNYGRDQDPMRPEFSYLRDVDYISGASILLRRELWWEMGGFDPWYDVAYAEDVDLAFRIQASGRRVVLQPWSMVLHFEGATSGTDIRKGVKAYQVSNLRKLRKRWRDRLEGHRPDGVDVMRERERGVTKRVLVVDALTPNPDNDAGSVFTVELIRLFQAIGYKVSFWPQDASGFDRTLTPPLQRIGVEAIYSPHYRSLGEYLAEHGELFDVVFIFRHYCASKLIPLVREVAPQARLIFHPADLHFIREARATGIDGCAKPPSILRLIQAYEIFCAVSSDVTIVHSHYEKDVLALHAPDATVRVFPWIVDPVPLGPGFAARNHIAYLGGYAHPPNVDAVRYFAEAIWPLIRQRNPEMVFKVVGSGVPAEIAALHGRNNIEVVGFVEDLQALFDSIRILVAPIRYGAGLKGKVASALAYGVPVVATSCAAEGMALVDGEQVLVRDDPEQFAEAVLRVYDDETLWQKLSAGGQAFVEEVFSRRRGLDRLREIVDAPLGTPAAGPAAAAPAVADRARERVAS